MASEEGTNAAAGPTGPIKEWPVADRIAWLARDGDKPHAFVKPKNPDVRGEYHCTLCGGREPYLAHDADLRSHEAASDG